MLRYPPTRITLTTEDIRDARCSPPRPAAPFAPVYGPRLVRGPERSRDEALVRLSPLPRAPYGDPVRPRTSRGPGEHQYSRFGSELRMDGAAERQFGPPRRFGTDLRADRAFERRVGAARQVGSEPRMDNGLDGSQSTRRSYATQPRLRSGTDEFPRSRLHQSHTLSSPERPPARESRAYRTTSESQSTDVASSIASLGATGSRYPAFSRALSRDVEHNVVDACAASEPFAGHLCRSRTRRQSQSASSDLSHSFSSMRRPILRRMVSHSTPNLVFREASVSHRHRASSLQSPAHTSASSSRKSSSGLSIQDILERTESPLERLQRNIASDMSRVPSLEDVLSASSVGPQLSRRIQFPSFDSSPERNGATLPGSFDRTPSVLSDPPSTPSPRRRLHDSNGPRPSAVATPALILPMRPHISERSSSRYHSVRRPDVNPYVARNGTPVTDRPTWLDTSPQDLTSFGPPPRVRPFRSTRYEEQENEYDINEEILAPELPAVRWRQTEGAVMDSTPPAEGPFERRMRQ